MSPLEKPVGALRSAYASTLLPVVTVADGGSHGSFKLVGPLASVSSTGAVVEA